MSELKERIAELKGSVLPLREFVAQLAKTARVDDDVVEYLEVKQQLLLSYCVNVVFYLYMKAEGKSVRAHPVMKQLLKLRYVMEKMRSLDGKLKYQVDRLVKLSEMSPADQASQASGLLRPNPSALLGRGNDSSDEEEQQQGGGESDEEQERRAAKKGEGVYRPPKMTAMPYKESESQAAKRDSRLDKQRKKIKNSELMDSLRDEFGTAPETSGSGGISSQAGDMRALREEQAERDRFEEERFVRMTMSRKDKKSIKQRTAAATRLDNFDDIGDVGDFEEVAKLAAQSAASARGLGGRMDVEDDDAAFSGRAGKKSSSSAAALQRAVQAMASGAQGRRGASSEYSDDEDGLGDDQFGAMLAADDKKRRRAPEGRMNDFEGEEEQEEDLVEEFGQRKKAFLAKKQDHYTAEPRFAGLVEDVAEGQKRAATYEIMKNKGLTPHRKKANRNPRVKKREAYAKAVTARKGQVRDVVTGAAGKYGGELTGIKANISRSRKISS